MEVAVSDVRLVGVSKTEGEVERDGSGANAGKVGQGRRARSVLKDGNRVCLKPCVFGEARGLGEV